MTVEIWSDVMCPFCYMGKRRFEAALAQFEHRDGVEVIWRSFQLDPSIRSTPGKDLYTYLAERKGMTREQSVRMHGQLVKAAAELGLTYNFDKAVVANSFDAHRLTHLAAAHGLQAAAEERLFAAYFTEGRDMSDHETLVSLGGEIGLDPMETKRMLADGAFAEEVRRDVREAELLGAEGVPFFVIDRKYGISGAQPSDLFLEALNKAWSERDAPTRESESEPVTEG